MQFLTLLNWKKLANTARTKLGNQGLPQAQRKHRKGVKRKVRIRVFMKIRSAESGYFALAVPQNLVIAT